MRIGTQRRATGFVVSVTIFLIFSFPLADAFAGEPGRNGLNTGMDCFIWDSVSL